jgi:hypothetical protein
MTVAFVVPSVIELKNGLAFVFGAVVGLTSNIAEALGTAWTFKAVVKFG